MHHESAGGVAPTTAEQAPNREWLHDSVRASLVLTFAGGAVIFALFAFVGQILPRTGVGWIPIVDGATAVALGIVAARLARARLGVVRMHALGYGFAVYCIVHGLAASTMSGSPGDVSFASFLVVGIGAVAVFWRPSLVLMAAAAVSTLVAVAATGGSDWLIATSILMATSVLLGVTILSARLRAFAQIEHLRAADERRSAELAEAVRQLELELAERHRAEEERAAVEARLAKVQSLDALGTLAGGVAHGMNNVLAVISGVAELGASESAADSEVRADFERILEAAGRGTDLTRNLLGFARRGKVRHAPFALDVVLREVVDELEGSAPAGVHFVTELEPVILVGDPGQLSQAVMNICLNAVEAVASSGTVRLRLRREAPTVGPGGQPASGPETVTLEITDDGIGMDEDDVAHAFQPFYAGRSASSGRHGLGLAMVFGTIRDHGGEVTLQSTLGSGTTVMIRLPEVPDEADSRLGDPMRSDAAADSAATTPAESPPQSAVLVVDDEPLVRRMVARMLELDGYACEVAEGGRAALALLADGASRFGLVVLDVAMPGMDGAATFEAIRRLDPTLPILLASGYPKDRRIEDLLALGRAEFLAKPFPREELLASAARMRRDRTKEPTA